MNIKLYRMKNSGECVFVCYFWTENWMLPSNVISIKNNTLNLFLWRWKVIRSSEIVFPGKIIEYWIALNITLQFYYY